MALSEQERKLLEQLEASLQQEDPQFAEMLSGSSHVRVQRRRATVAGLGFLVGLGCLIGGIQLHWSVSIIGFAVMVAATIVGINSWQRVGDEGEPADKDEDKPKAPTSSNKEFMDKLEERWRKRQQGDM